MRVGCAAWALGGTLSLTTPAGADTGEVGLQPTFASGRARATVEGRDTAPWVFGGGAALTLGLAPAWTASARYELAFSATQSLPGDDPRTREVYTVRRHALSAGLAWAPSDQLTPRVAIEAGAANTVVAHRQWRVRIDGAEQRIAPDPADASRWSPAARLSAGGEWRFADFTSVSAMPYLEWAAGPGFGLQVQLGLYRYL